MAVYFIQCGEYVKIGFTNNLKKRFQGLRISNPHDLKILAVIEGDRSKEREMHQTFHADWVRGEWYLLSSAIQAFLKPLPVPETPRIFNRRNSLEFLQGGTIDGLMIDRLIRENLLAIAKAYGRAEKASMSTVSKRAYGHSRFLEEFAAGRKSISVQKCDEVLEWFRANWPEDTPWPMVRPVFMGRKDQAA